MTYCFWRNYVCDSSYFYSDLEAQRDSHTKHSSSIKVMKGQLVVMLLSSMTHLCLLAIINEEVKENFKCENNTRLRCIQGVFRKKREKRNIQGSSMLLKKSKYLNILT